MNLHSETRSKVKTLSSALRKAETHISLADGETEPDTPNTPPATAIRDLAAYVAKGTDEVLVTISEHRSDEHAHLTVTISKVAS